MEKELRIGNWVYYNRNGKKRYREIVGIKNEKVEITGVTRWVKIESIQPIPLTEEILLKCGFEKRYGKYGYYFVNTKLSGFRIWAHEDHDQHKWVIGKKNFETGNTFVIKAISKYLHDVQNLFFALTNEELGINL